MSLPLLTRGISLTVHESVWPKIVRAALTENDGNVNKYIRMLLYKDLFTRGLLTPVEILDLYLPLTEPKEGLTAP